MPTWPALFKIGSIVYIPASKSVEYPIVLINSIKIILILLFISFAIMFWGPLKLSKGPQKSSRPFPYLFKIQVI